ncbi:cytochrome P450 1A1-like [Glandiceps talaboti]
MFRVDLLTLMIVVVTILTCVWLLKYFDKNATHGPSIPGPWGLPIIGHVLSLGDNPHLSLTKMAKRYGPIVQIRIGRRPVIVLTGLSTLKQAFIRQGTEFAGRPDFKSFQRVSRGLSIAFNSYSQSWKIHKKIATTALKTCMSGKLLEGLEKQIQNEAMLLVNVLTTPNSLQGHGIDPRHPVRLAVTNIISVILFGKKYAHEDKELQHILDLAERLLEAFGTGNPTDIMPWTAIFPSVRRMRDTSFEVLDDLYDWLEVKKREHSESFDPDNIRDVTDKAIHVSRQMNPEDLSKHDLTYSRVMTVVNDIFGAGFDSSAATMMWFILYMVKHQEIQQRIRDELDQVVGSDRLPCLADKPNLPFTVACVHETLRISTIAPLAVPHTTSCDTTLNGYFIPKDTLVFPNLWGTNYDEDVFPNPTEFNPERFMTDDGTSLDKAQVEDYVPFSVGRRRCLGEEVAHLQLFLFIATILHQCTLDKPDGQTLSFECIYSLNLTPKPFEIIAHKRFSQ